MNFEDIGSLLSGLSEDDMAALKDAAQQFMGGQEEKKGEEQPADFFGGIAPEMIGKIMQILPLLQSGADNERTRLICALKPLLSPVRRRKADEAMQIMRLLDVLPLVQKIL